jgi:hypothetical protein
MPEYGRDSGRRLGQGGLVLHTKQGDKRTLMIRLVQIGIDTFGTINAGARFTGFGGINCGWKWPVVLAGLALKDPRILTVAHAGEFTRGQANPGQNFNFSFDRQTWYVTPSDVGRTLYTEDGRPREVYIASDIGKPEWGEQHWKQPVRDGRNWDASYRDLAFAGEFGGLLSALLIKGGREAWGWPVAFDYLDRYMKDVPNGPLGSLPNKLSAWEVAMYTTYRFQGRTPSAPNNLRAAP